ncbi:MAG: AAA family ATPase [Lentimicrobiaceae bacterium]|jgi:predicted AAA+ superfamily ATPase|nr:AAA family ATPase [Lentimicrobiaceae bacterium]
MFQRSVLDNLGKWANKSNRKPLVLRGMRQVGKTTLVTIFAKQFDTYLYLNLENKQAHTIFEDSPTMDDLLTAIYLHCNKARTSGKVLLFIDEIQNSPAAVAQLRYFYEEAPEIYVIAAGSLLESLIDTHISFPVGRVEYMAVRPCSFTEFLGAIGETELQKAIVDIAVPKSIHDKAKSLFNTYTLIGGMPEIVAHYAEHRDLVAINDIYETLLSGYRDDVEKYARNDTMKNIIRYILKEGWQYAAQRISLGSFAGSSYKAREIGEAFRTLEKTMLLELTYPSISCELPAPAELKRSPKLLWSDTGLVNYAVKIQGEIFAAKDVADAWRGKVAEQIVAQELLAADARVSNHRSFWVRDKKGSDAEIDFTLQQGSHIIPIEVKSGHNSKLKSLHLYLECTSHRTAVRVWSQPFSIDSVKTPNGKEFSLYNVPFYYVGGVERILERGKI